jgi:hypothetical protein
MIFSSDRVDGHTLDIILVFLIVAIMIEKDKYDNYFLVICKTSVFVSPLFAVFRLYCKPCHQGVRNGINQNPSHPCIIKETVFG